ncbi:MAG: hypothetical protein ACI35W_07205 [Anaeroplasmataceae bacterium]
MLKNKKSIKSIIVISMILLLLVSTSIAFAAYTFNRNIDVDTEVGNIASIEKYYVNYAKNPASTDGDASKLRTDTVAVIDGIKLSYNSSYVAASGTFQSGVKYYVKDGDNYVIADVTIGNTITSGYYVESKEYTGISSVSTAYDLNLNTLDITINTFKMTFVISAISYEVTTVVADSGLITSANVSGEATKTYTAVIRPNGLGMVILDDAITSSEDAYTQIEAREEFVCSATENRQDNSNYYLNQLGLKFTVQAEIPVYVRISIKDAWIRTRIYASSVQRNYILKDQISGASPFQNASEDWYFDSQNNYVYLKTMIDSTEATSFIFNVNQAYFYADESTSIYKQYIEVGISFEAEAVQANRVVAVWGLDPSTL